MLEIILLSLLATKNSVCARVRGRSGGAAVAYTIVLWLGLEIAAFALLSTMDSVSVIGAYALGLAGAGVGALISYIISAAGQEKYARDDARMYLKQEQLAHLDLRLPIDPPCKVVAINDAGAVRVAFPVLLNARMVGAMQVDPITFETSVTQNIVSFADAQGMAIKNPLLFDAPAGGLVEIHYSGNSFIADKLKVYVNQSAAPAALLFAAAAPNAPAASAGAQAAPAALVCPRCGAQLREGAVFCGSCGTNLAQTPPAAAAVPAATVTSKPADGRSCGFTKAASIIDIVHAAVTIGLSLAISTGYEWGRGFAVFIGVYSVPALIFAIIALASLKKPGGCPKWLGTIVRILFVVGIVLSVILLVFGMAE